MAAVWRGGKRINVGNGSSDATVGAVNAHGAIAGFAAGPSGVGATLWQGGRRKYLGTFGTNLSQATALNERGHVVGVTRHYGATGYPPHPFLWRDGRLTDMGTLGGNEARPVAINDRDQVIGRSKTRGGGSHPFLWEHGRMRDLASRGDGWDPRAINNIGEIIGNATRRDRAMRAVVWRKGRLISLPTLGGSQSHASAINDRGQIVGWAETKAGERHATLWQRGRVADLGTLGGTSSAAVAINDGGSLAGTFTTRSGTEAFVWQTGRMTALPRIRGIDGYEIVAVNARGDVAATGHVKDDPNIPVEISHAVLWTHR